MAKILSLETSTAVCSVAIHEGGQLIASAELRLGQSHSTHLTSLVDQVLINAGLELTDLSAVAVSEGPGSYTGLRIGVSTAKGFCYAADLPLIAVNSLEAMAVPFADLQNYGVLCPMLDARRMEVYTCLIGGALKTTPLVLDENSFEKELKEQKVYFFGNGSDKFREIVKTPNAVFLKGVEPSAEGVGVLAFDKFTANDFVDVAYFEPFYLKEFYTTAKKIF